MLEALPIVDGVAQKNRVCVSVENLCY